MDKQIQNGQWVEEVMDSLNGIQRIPASPGMYDRVTSRLASEAQGSRVGSVVLIRRIAVAAILLITINLFSIIHQTRKVQPTHQRQDVYQVVSEDIGYLTDDN